MLASNVVVYFKDVFLANFVLFQIQKQYQLSFCAFLQFKVIVQIKFLDKTPSYLLAKKHPEPDFDYLKVFISFAENINS